MSQSEILKLLTKEEYLFGTEIIQRLKKEDECGENIRRSLKKLRDFNEVGFILINYKNKNLVAKKNKYLRQKLEKGYSIRRPSFMYFKNK